MGQRANYILIEEDGFSIHYSHWRANQIVVDLFKGEKVFLRYLNECERVDEILEEPWIEGCVVIHPKQKKLWFWSFEAPMIYSVQSAIVSRLEALWKNWEIEILHGDMVDVGRILDIHIPPESPVSPNDEAVPLQIYEEEDSFSSLVMVRQNERITVGRFGYQDALTLLHYGPGLIRFVLDNGSEGLPSENQVDTDHCLLIDVDRKQLYTSKYLYPTASILNDWHEYTRHEGLGPYLRTLQYAGVEVSGLAMTPEELQELMDTIQFNDSDFDPDKMARQLLAEHGDVTFSPMFFDKVKPRLTVWDRIVTFFKRGG